MARRRPHGGAYGLRQPGEPVPDDLEGPLSGVTVRRSVTEGRRSVATAPDSPKLAYDIDGDGVPVVFLHGLTFDRRSWRPIVERLDGSVRSIAIDLPAHGDSPGVPAPLEAVAAQVHELLTSLAVERPIVVGHSMSGGLAWIYAAAYPTRGVVFVDSG